MLGNDRKNLSGGAHGSVAAKSRPRRKKKPNKATRIPLPISHNPKEEACYFSHIVLCPEVNEKLRSREARLPLRNINIKTGNGRVKLEIHSQPNIFPNDERPVLLLTKNIYPRFIYW